MTACYFQYYLRKDDRPKTIASFISKVVDAGKEPERRQSKLSDREPFNWVPKLSYFMNDFFLAAADLFILKNYSKGT